MHKLVQFLLAAMVFLTGCARGEEPEIKVDLSSIEERNQQVSAAILSSDWKSLTALFSSAVRKSRHALSEAWQETGMTSCTLQTSEPVKEENRTAGYLTFSCREGKELAVIDYNDVLNITSLIYESLPEEKNLESNSIYVEQSITIGSKPSLQGILTMPAGASYPPVAVLMPEGAADEMDASGNDSTFRKDLAHSLAQKGIATVRYDMRAYEDPSILRPSLLSFDRIYGYDFAWCIHHLETYPVDASTILYIGHGTAGTLGYKLVNDHFEISGGMVLLNARFQTGLQLMSDVFSVSNEDAQAAQEAISSGSEVESIGTYPLSFYREWMEADPLNHTKYVAIPIAILQGEKDDIATMSDFNQWKSQKGSNVSMKSYPSLSHSMRQSDGSISEQMVSDIHAWLNGENIEESEESKEEESDES